MAEIDEIRIRVGDNFEQVNKGFKNLESQAKRSSTNINRDLGSSFKKSAESAKELQGQLRGVEEEGVKAGESIFGAFKKAAGAFLAIEGLSRAVGFFKDAVTAANRFESSLVGLEATADRTGQSFDKAKKSVLDLAEDGQIGIGNASRSVQFLLNQGQDIDQAFKTAEAVKQISALENITGDAGQATEDLFKGLITNSAELVENASPRFRQIANDFGGLTEVTKNAEVRQQFFNKVIKEAEQIGGNYNKFLETGQARLKRFAAEQEQLNISIGRAINEAIGPVSNTVIDLITQFRAFIDTIRETRAGAAAFTVLFAPIIKIITLTGKAIQGLIAVISGLLEGFTSLINAIENNKAFQNLAAVIGLVFDQLQALASAIFGRILAAFNAIKTSFSDGLGADILAKTIEIARNAVFSIIASFKTLIELINRFENDGVAAVKQVGSIFTEEFNKLLLVTDKVDESTKSVTKSVNNLGNQGSAAGRKVKDSFQGLTDFLKSDFERALDSNEKAFLEFVDSVNEAQKRGLIGFGEAANLREQARQELSSRVSSLVDDQLRVIKEFNEEALQLDIDRIEAERKAAIEAAEDVAKFKKSSEFDLAKERERINAQANKKIVQAQIKSAEQTAGQVGGVLGGISQIAQGGSPTNFLRGVGQIGDQFLPGVGGLVNQFAGIFDTVGGLFTSLFDNSEELRRQEEERIEQLKVQQELVKNQRNLTKELAELERRRQTLISAEAQREIQLNNLLIQDEQARNQANLEVIQGLANTLGERIGIEDAAARPQAVAQQISNTELSVIENQSARAIIQALANSVASRASLLGGRAIDSSNLFTAQDLASLDRVINNQAVDAGLRSQANNLRATISEFISRRRNEPSGRRLGQFLKEEIFEIQNVFGSRVDPILNFADDLISAQENRLEDADQLLGLLEDIQSRQQDISQASTLNLQGGREVSFVDVGRLGLQSLGVFRGARIDPQQLSLPRSLESVAVASQAQKSFQERQADSLETLVEIQTQALIALNNISTSLGGGLDQQITAFLSDLQSRSIS